MSTSAPATGATNPFVALAALSPEMANLYELDRYVFVVTLGAYTWDWLVSMSQEYKMVKRDGLTINLAVYFASRLVTQAFVVVGVAVVVAPFPDCNAILRSIAIIAIFVTITSGYLFLVRVRAIFHGHRWLLGLFTLLWVAVGATSLLVPFSVSGHHIEGSQQCIPIDMHPRTGVYAFIYIVNHVLIFICTSWKLVTIQHGMNGSMRNILRGQGFSNISAVLWSSGQLYFFTTVGVDIVNLVFIIMPGSNVLHHYMLITASDALGNAMACRIFRQLRFSTQSVYTNTTLQGTTLPLSFRSSGNGNGNGNGNGTGNDGRQQHIHFGSADRPGVSMSTEGTYGGSLPGPPVLNGGSPDKARSPLEVNVQTHVQSDAALDAKSAL